MQERLARADHTPLHRAEHYPEADVVFAHVGAAGRGVGRQELGEWTEPAGDPRGLTEAP